MRPRHPRPRSRRPSPPVGAAARRPLAAALLPAAAALLPAGLAAQTAGGPPSGEPPPLVGDRPDFTESASVVPLLQIETGYTFEEAGGTELHTVGELLLRLPVASRVELRIGVPSWAAERGDAAPERRSGLTDASAGLKLALRSPGRGTGDPAVALLAGATVPTGDEFGSAGLHPRARLAAALDLSERLSLAANAGAASARGAGDGRHAEISGSVSLGVGLTGSVGAYLESYVVAPTGSEPATSVVNGGLTWLAGPGFQLDARIGAGLSGPSPDLLLGTGVVWRP